MATNSELTTAQVFRNAATVYAEAATVLERQEAWPHGAPVTNATMEFVGAACQALTGETGRSAYPKALALYKLITDDYGYMPEVAARTLIRASNTDNLVPYIAEPIPT